MSNSVVWSKGDEPVRVGSKVLCNYSEDSFLADNLEPVGVVIGHDGSHARHSPWVVLTNFLNGKDHDYNYFVEWDLKVLGNYDSPEDVLEASRQLCGGEPTGGIKDYLLDISDQFGKVHKELENE